MKYTLFLSLLFFAGALPAQSTRLVTVVDVERAFARKARETSIRQAFLAYMDSSSLVVDGENRIIAGRPAYEAAPESPASLRWWPEFAASSMDGQFGFTTGPYDLRATATADTAVRRGEFATVWRRSDAGEWKFIIDLGISYEFQNTVPSRQEIVPPDNDRDKKPDKTYLETEMAFAKLFDKGAARAYRAYLADRFRLLRPRAYPITPEALNDRSFEKIPALGFEIAGHAVAPSGDMAVVYGYAVPKKGDGLTQKNVFLRVWRREGRKWKLVLEVLRY